MSPFMSQVASKADFIQTDITYDHMLGYRYLFNAVAFNNHIREWMVGARVWLDQQDAAAYAQSYLTNASRLPMTSL